MIVATATRREWARRSRASVDILRHLYPDYGTKPLLPDDKFVVEAALATSLYHNIGAVCRILGFPPNISGPSLSPT